MSYYPELDNLTLDELIERFEAPEPHDKETWHWEIAYMIRGLGTKAANRYLCAQLKRVDEADTDRLRMLVGALSTVPHDSYSTSVKALSRRQTKWFRRRLKRYLNDDRNDVVTMAIRGFWWLRDRAVRKRIKPFLQHSDGYVRGAALEYWAAIKGEKAFGLLVAALDDDFDSVRDSAIDGLLYHLYQPWVLTLIEPMLDDPSEFVRSSAARAIGIYSDSAVLTIDVFDPYVDADQPQLQAMLTAAEIIRLLDFPTRQFVYKLIRENTAVPEIISALRQVDVEWKRQTLISALRHRYDESAVSVLLECLKDPHRWVQNDATEVLDKWAKALYPSSDPY